ncbi:carboxyvinyl-carboxyphosphonate phosphorylmutase [Amycolatopsis mediterranei S699]|uniref:Carboxyvinyl-carboxyphosphonate phosphorylmutase n=2 Tax=Amycolatopsis mediterranei TaxID=33910 RepID=A0A0H3D1M3_AMYMU|nr:isocitrate lyase/phosphoenolpyruvate mutase family protein [Amycolatopsis mediterranei]ADJ43396.1 carboxyvinyl-carboxyphosphonate phosphorylmutase [Amycolatopsis mediterranei U32]AEK40098.1 carboxyvinyl-carboxyphosphonate phosphorylmutase [Amycolatopsis mediterranei S699]AFO75109.1 carboxyvinyl-carboxyphosphonate phosphorylmutase [Amycolatopsis mediterranei S699]AGT82238.1 carboxyvinyl-carboxyphosphonate phosphorylmutase [Amycolatopsis mediterranei RB]KDO11699.1 carboxyvinyl-carboxyphosphon
MTAAALRALHVPGKPLVLANVWDADTAKLVEAAGFPAIATSSVAVAAALGFPDGEQAPADEMFAAAARIAKAVGVPVTVDAESGYGLSGVELAGRLLGAGAVGCNFEDTDHATGDVRPVEAQAARIAALRAAAGDGLVINARIDSFRGVDPEEALDAGVARAKAYLEAGADCVYPIHLRTPELIAEFVRGTGGAVNTAAWPGSPGLEGLADLGVARISLGGGLWQYVRKQFEAAVTGVAQGKLPY